MVEIETDFILKQRVVNQAESPAYLDTSSKCICDR